MRKVIMSVLVLSGLACAGVPAAPQQPTAAAVGPDTAAIQIAAAVGLPQVIPGSGAAGPFSGPDGIIYYLDHSGRVTWFNPQTFQAFMGQSDGQLVYGMALDGFYAFQGGQAVNVGDPPADLGQWPHAEPIAMVMVALLQSQYAAQAQSLNSGSHYQAMSDASAGWHDVNMQIADNIGGVGCVEQYEGPYYVGCY